jgi:hypothetical protein
MKSFFIFLKRKKEDKLLFEIFYGGDDGSWTHFQNRFF